MAVQDSCALQLEADSRAAAWDAFAGSYDFMFTDTLLGRTLRRRVWDRLAASFGPGQCVLDIGCGTGEDSLWMAKRGLLITVLDISPEMIRMTVAKHEALGMAVEAVSGPAEGVLAEFANAGRLFDGAYSNFGALNCVRDLNIFGLYLAEVLRPGAKLVLVPMSPFCPVEIIWMLLHGHPKQAFRRFGRRVEAQLGRHRVMIHYPSLPKLRAQMADWFAFVRAQCLGLLLPTTELARIFEGHTLLVESLNQLERLLGRNSFGVGDHYIAEFKRLG